MPHAKLIILCLLCTALAFFLYLQIEVYRARDLPMNHVEATYPNPPQSELSSQQFARAQRLDCTEFSKGRAAVIIVAGQSNAGNFVQRKGINKHGPAIANYFAGECKVASDPLMGAHGELGSPWITLANRLIESGKYDRILLVPVVFGGTSMTRWRSGGDLRLILEHQMRRLKLERLPVTHILWTQGEADRIEGSIYRRDNGDNYLRELLSLAAATSKYTNATLYVTLTSSCIDRVSSHLGPAPEIRRAQEKVVSATNNVRQGPDLDNITLPGDRYDGCHLSEQGATKFVNEWVAILAPAK